jgi:hypothetical protein
LLWIISPLEAIGSCPASGGENYEVKYLTKEPDVTRSAAMSAIKAIWNNREKIVAYIKEKTKK